MKICNIIMFKPPMLSKKDTIVSYSKIMDKQFCFVCHVSQNRIISY